MIGKIYVIKKQLKKYVNKLFKQCFLKNKMIIGLTGRIAAGKGAIAKYFERENFIYSSLSNAVRKEAKEKGIAITRSNLQDLGNLLRKQEGANIWAKKVVEIFDTSKDYIVDGIRNPAEIEELKKLKNFYLISIDASQKERYRRVLKRAKPSDPKDWEGFLNMDKRDFGEENSSGQQVYRCMKIADFNLVNNSTIGKLYTEIKKIHNQIKGKC